MALIEVNHQTLREVAEEIGKYCTAQDDEMRKADQRVKEMLSSDWLGMDAKAFEEKWEDVDGNESIAIKFRDALKSFAGNLQSCAKEYSSAQEDVYNAAAWLPKK